MTMQPRFGWLTAILIGLLIAFIGGDAAAHFSNYQYGETVSKFIQGLVKAMPWLRIVIFGLLIDLAVHLSFSTPLF
jgi:hypothetical protein